MIRLQGASEKFVSCICILACVGLSRTATVWRKWFNFVTLIFNSSSNFEKFFIICVQYSTIYLFFLYFNQEDCGYVFQICVSNDFSTLWVFRLDMVCSDIADREEPIINTTYNTTLFPPKVLLTMLMCLSILFLRVHRQVCGRQMSSVLSCTIHFVQKVFADHQIALSYFSVLFSKQRSFWSFHFCFVYYWFCIYFFK